MIYTYLLAANNLFKIGKTKNIKKRLSILGTASPDIQLIDFCNECYSEVEIFDYAEDVEYGAKELAKEISKYVI